STPWSRRERSAASGQLTPTLLQSVITEEVPMPSQEDIEAQQELLAVHLLGDKGDFWPYTMIADRPAQRALCAVAGDRAQRGVLFPDRRVSESDPDPDLRAAVRRGQPRCRAEPSERALRGLPSRAPRHVDGHLHDGDAA